MTTAPIVINTDPLQTETDIVSQWEAIADKTLFPGQAERLLINLIAYRETLLRIGIQWAFEQSLVNFAIGDALDQLGALVGATRLTANFAATTVEFSLAAVREVDTLIPQGTRARVPGSEVIFSTDEDVTITTGQLTTTVAATALTAGIAGNGFAVSSITEILDPIAGVFLVASNPTVSNGGGDIEADDRYRERIKLAPSQFSVAGPAQAYRFHALSVSSTITSAKAIMPFNDLGGMLRIYVDVYLLTEAGLPSTELIAQVQARLDDGEIRPLNDIVTVKAPTEVSYSIDADITLLETADAIELSQQISDAVDAYIQGRASDTGQDIVLNQIIAAIACISGVYDVTVNLPAADIVVTESEWANHSGNPALNIVGTNEG